MAGGGGGGGGGGGEGGHGHTDNRTLEETPTWSVAMVCAVIVIISISLEKFIHKFAKVFEAKKKLALLEALEKIKAELMVLGFISLLLTFGQSYISKVCVPQYYANQMLPCSRKKSHGPPEEGHDTGGGGGENEAAEHRRRLLSYERRFLAGGGGFVECKLGSEPLISVGGLHQLHIFIFFLAVFHVIYSAITMTLGRAKIRAWKQWEQSHLVDEDALNDPRRFRLTHETSFVRDHSSFWTKTPVSFYFVCFFRQFIRSVRRADYLTMRHGFVSVHLAPGSKFDFQKYIKRSLEDDFKVVVGISPILWASVVLFLLVNVNEWHASFGLSFLPLAVVLSVGTKLQAIITRMALDIKERHAVVQGIPLVQVSDKYFWFQWPQLVLYLIHYVLFQNAFELTFFCWTWYEFGLNSCFYENKKLMYFRVAVGVGAQIVCSYVTLPLYALVTQMGSTMKKSIFDDQTSRALKKWHKNALKKANSKGRGTEIRTLGGSPRHSPRASENAYSNIAVTETQMTEQTHQGL
ncbi:PREDICTED: MLO-like protein 9 [Lupinus angustifolius]|uniref:MLO-like protein 9 n=1 Tax=Lupinus angustifolius TaxID=3871 RepID=UPI00092F6CC1|nr:PREDICTED: MLO-like protein 9 [Lupinus angustifolius]